MTTTINILIVGDDEETCAHVAQILSAKDWQTDSAWIGSKALELARKNTYNGVVFDYRKPLASSGESGPISATRSLQVPSSTSATPSWLRSRARATLADSRIWV
jgi:CheY-like chemotaxis protein